MILGPNCVYKCPNCGNLLRTVNLVSGNTWGAEIFSDSRVIASDSVEFPCLTKCNKCDKIFWLSKLEEIGTLGWSVDEKVDPDWENADWANYLTVDEYFESLNKGLAENKKDEIFIRRQIWWGYNDRLREGNELFSDVNDESKWFENCNRLISLLDVSDMEESFMIAELKRNLGDFKGCLEIIKVIDNDELNWAKDTFISECEKGNKWVVKLN